MMAVVARRAIRRGRGHGPIGLSQPRRRRDFGPGADHFHRPDIVADTGEQACAILATRMRDHSMTEDSAVVDVAPSVPVGHSPNAGEIARLVRVRGTVQGVGFRPFLYDLANEHGLAGHVLNDSMGVLCQLVGPEAGVNRFIDDIRSRSPRLAVVEHVEVQPVGMPSPPPRGFSIAPSQSLPSREAHLPVDTHACDDCLREMRDPNDRRFRYPFINCANCGPRYSIVGDLPYDRSATTMSSFPMCARCRAEYEDPGDRRYHAQPIACHDCGPELTGVDVVTGQAVRGEAALAEAARRLKGGEIVAIKGVGGFHLAVDAASPEAVALLRRLKRRDAKPFAIMARSLAAAARVVVLTGPERAIVASGQRPILLARKAGGSEELAPTVAPRNPSLGLMLPSAPHHELLFDHLELDFVVMTSGNISGHPIEIGNAGARARLGEIASFILEHNRDIANRLDDSVVRLTEPGEPDQPFLSFLRRGRGYAPYYLSAPHPVETGILGTGSELKATAALAAGATIYATQHVGDLTNHETRVAHHAAVDRLAHLYGIEPEEVLSDLHPAFLARARQQYGSGRGVQHHHAHLASCLLDHGLPDARYIGVVLDGVGYGNDGSMWGAEFLVGGYREVTRATSLRTIPLIGGDAAVRQPARVAFALARHSGALGGRADQELADLLGLTHDECRVFGRMLDRKVNTFEVSSMGRLFDGVAALAGFARKSEYEAQGPIEFEGLMNRRHEVAEPYRPMPLSMGADGVDRLDWGPLICDVIADLRVGTPPAMVSRRFHTSVAEAVSAEAIRLARLHETGRVALSGGVFLNEFLTVHIPRLLIEGGCTPYRHQRVPTNDGGIAPGQVAVRQARLVAPWAAAPVA